MNKYEITQKHTIHSHSPPKTTTTRKYIHIHTFTHTHEHILHILYIYLQTSEEKKINSVTNVLFLLESFDQVKFE